MTLKRQITLNQSISRKSCNAKCLNQKFLPSQGQGKTSGWSAAVSHPPEMLTKMWQTHFGLDTVRRGFGAMRMGIFAVDRADPCSMTFSVRLPLRQDFSSAPMLVHVASAVLMPDWGMFCAYFRRVPLVQNFSKSLEKMGGEYFKLEYSEMLLLVEILERCGTQCPVWCGSDIQAYSKRLCQEVSLGWLVWPKHDVMVCLFLTFDSF